MKKNLLENKDAISDEELIRKCLENNEKYCEMIYYRFRKQMFQSAYRILRDENIALDAVQDSFIKAFEHLKEYKADSEFAFWLKRITINTSLNILKKEKRFIGFLNEEAELSDMEENELDIDTNLLQIDAIKKAIEKLPKGYSLIFQLKLFEGLEHSEIADYLQISESTSKTQYRKAKQKIVEILKSEKNNG